MTDPTANVNPMSGPGDSRPVPDPTLLTTQQLLREMSNLKEVIFTRLDGMDRAMIVFNENITRVPTDVDKQVGHLKELHQEKFDGVQKQFEERDTRIEQTARDSKTAIDAALLAAKELVGLQTQASDRAIGKSETATSKQLDQLAVQIQGETRALDGKITDIKDRLTLIEGRGSGMQASWLVAVAVIGMLLTVGGLILALTR
jgi:hypothetical protein